MERRLAKAILECTGTVLILIALTFEAHSFFHVQRYVDMLGSIDLKMAEQLTYSALWAVSAALILLVGFAMKDTVLRIAAIVILFSIMLKVVTVDLAGLGSLYRVLSFLCLGLILLATSLAYNKFRNKLLAGLTEKSSPGGPL